MSCLGEFAMTVKEMANEAKQKLAELTGAEEEAVRECRKDEVANATPSWMLTLFLGHVSAHPS